MTIKDKNTTRELALKYRELAVNTLADICMDDEAPAAARASAATQLLDRIDGRPHASTEVQVTGPNGGPIQSASLDLSKLTADEFSTIRQLMVKARLENSEK